MTRSILRSPPIDKLAFIYGSVELPVRDVLFRMERNGILIDAVLLASTAGSSASA